MMHVALKLRSDLKDQPGHESSWKDINQESVEKVIPESLYLFLSLLFSGTDALDTNEEEDELKTRICSIAQDIVFAFSQGKKRTPKHIGLG